MVMAYLICRATFVNGVRIGIVKTKNSVFCGAVLGTTVQTAGVQLAAAATIQRLPTSASVFVVCQDFLLRSSRFTLVRAWHGLNCFTAGVLMIWMAIIWTMD